MTSSNLRVGSYIYLYGSVCEVTKREPDIRYTSANMFVYQLVVVLVLPWPHPVRSP